MNSDDGEYVTVSKFDIDRRERTNTSDQIIVRGNLEDQTFEEESPVDYYIDIDTEDV